MPTNKPICEKGVLTIAHGDPIYIEMAKSLARSIDRFSPGLPKAIVTDSDDEDLKQSFQFIIPLNPNWGTDVRQKLYLDLYTPFKKTIFIDSDCLVLRSLLPAFNAFSGGQCIVPNRTWELSEQNPHHGTDFQKLQQKTGLRAYTGFNGGLYYLEEETPTINIFERGREILEDFESYGLCEFREGRGCPGDEPVLGIALTQLNSAPTEFAGLLIASPFGLNGKFHLDAVRGQSSFQHYHENLSPSVIHFGRGFCGEPSVQSAYERECRRLLLVAKYPLTGKLQATLYRNFHDFRRKSSEIISLLWEVTPPTLRHRLHGIRSRLKKIGSHSR